jgi:caffeoyl-CoA O-methyltransferase
VYNGGGPSPVRHESAPPPEVDDLGGPFVQSERTGRLAGSWHRPARDERPADDSENEPAQEDCGVFHDIPETVLSRMRFLEAMDGRQRIDGTDHLERLRQVPPVTGRFLAVLAASAPPGAWLEIGTSGGYSALWLTLACRAVGARLTTFEVLESKAALARETFHRAGVEALVDLVVGDARDHLRECEDVAFCFLDAEKEYYDACYEALVPSMVEGGIIAADNVISHEEILQPVVDKALRDVRVDAVVVPIGSGILVARRV